MNEESPLLAGCARLAIDAVIGVTDAVEALHATVARRVAPFGRPAARTRARARSRASSTPACAA
jgi:hypothetical protein